VEEPISVDAGRKKQTPAWSQNKGERQALLQKRREEMILSARRKMEEKLEKERAEKQKAV
jgi:coupling of ubiquitin conjugation to ER degradation protein 1